MAKKKFFSKHAKSSAALISLTIHLIIVIVALSYVAVTVIQKEDNQFEGKQVKRPVQKLKKLQVPVKQNKNKPKPKLRKQITVKNLNRQTPDFKMPEITGVRGGLGTSGDGGGSVETIGFTMPEMDFFGSKAKGEKICFLVHFGPNTMSERMEGSKAFYTPFSRMTALTIRNRLSELISELPSYTLFNIAAFYSGDTWAISPEMMVASPVNKKKVFDWMEPVNPVDPDASSQYDHCFSIGSARGAVNNALGNWPTRVEKELPFYAPKWIYPYEVDKSLRKKYAPDAAEFTINKIQNPHWSAGNAFSHWARALAWAILEQKPDTIFVLTTNYIDGWQVTNELGVDWRERRVKNSEPAKTARAFANMIRDIYGPDKKQWPSVNVVVLTQAGKTTDSAYQTLDDQFSFITKSFNGQGSVIEDIKDFMNESEKDMFYEYKSKYSSSVEND